MQILNPISNYSNYDIGIWKTKKLDLPFFDGDNSDGWIMKVKRDIHFYKLNEEEKVEVAMVNLEGNALVWFRWKHQRRPIGR